MAIYLLITVSQDRLSIAIHIIIAIYVDLLAGKQAEGGKSEVITIKILEDKFTYMK